MHREESARALALFLLVLAMLWLLLLVNPSIVVLLVRADTGLFLLAFAISCGCCLGLLVVYSIICCGALWVSEKVYLMGDYLFRCSWPLLCRPRRLGLCGFFMIYYCLVCAVDGSLAAWRCRYLLPFTVLRSVQGLASTIGYADELFRFQRCQVHAEGSGLDLG